ncbi:MAG: response regulator transcription factor [Salinivirgaceae bacterium]|jgi:DNA-binding NarL/FixJ family response regulator
MKIIVVDDNEEFLTNITFFLEKRLNHTVIASFSDGESFFNALADLSPDIILMDISLPGLDGYSITKKINWEYHYYNVLALTMFKDIAYLQKLIEVGFKGCVFKSDVYNDLPLAIDAVINGKYFWPDGIDMKNYK